MALSRLAQAFVQGMRNLLHATTGVSGTCRFVPTCSQYCNQAIEKHGIFIGSWWGIKRLLKCHPWGTGGLDLVPRNKVLEKC